VVKKSWGRWTLCVENMTLAVYPWSHDTPYEIDLEKCTAWEIADWLQHLARKRPEYDAGGAMEAFDALRAVGVLPWGPRSKARLMEWVAE
jgi:hypothetical protein